VPPYIVPLSFIHAGGLHVEARNFTRGLMSSTSCRIGMMIASSCSIEKCASVGSVSPAGTSSYEYADSAKSLAPIGSRM
jgi:hypothetical protein